MTRAPGIGRARHGRPCTDARPHYRTDQKRSSAGSARKVRAQCAACAYRYLVPAARARSSTDPVVGPHRPARRELDAADLRPTCGCPGSQSSRRNEVTASIIRCEWRRLGIRSARTGRSGQVPAAPGQRRSQGKRRPSTAVRILTRCGSRGGEGATSTCCASTSRLSRSSHSLASRLTPSRTLPTGVFSKPHPPCFSRRPRGTRARR